MNGEKKEADIFEDVCQMVTGTSILSNLRCHKDEVRRVLEIMPLDQYSEEQIASFRRYVFNDTEESRRELAKRKQMMKKLMLDFGIDTR